MIMTKKGIYAKGRHKMQFAPMVDCVFLLLIFFLVTSEMRPVEGDYDTNIPANGVGVATPDNETKEVIKVWVADVAGKGQEIRLMGRPVSSFAALASELADMKGKNSLVVIDGPPDVSIQTVAEVLDATVKAGIPAMTFSDPERK